MINIVFLNTLLIFYLLLYSHAFFICLQLNKKDIENDIKSDSGALFMDGLTVEIRR